MKCDFDIRYDRRCGDELAAVVAPGKPAHALVEIATGAAYPVDLMVRADPKTGAQWLTLYVGLTKALDLFCRPSDGRVRLDAHPRWRSQGRFREEWVSWASPEELGATWPEVDLYLERVIPAATKSHGLTEGAVQAAVSKRAHGWATFFDREVVTAFRNDSVRRERLGESRAPLMRVVDRTPFGSKPKNLGAECDAVAVDDRGRLLAVEIKPSGTSSVSWVGAQAAMYARVLGSWVAHDDTHAAVVNGMIKRRADLGLLPNSPHRVATSPPVVPVVALQKGATTKLKSQMFEVADAIDKVSETPPLEFYEVAITGELTRLERP